MNKIGNLQEQLKSKGYKITGPRKTILNLFENNQGRTFTAQELHKILADEGIDFSTIYRNLEIMAKEGMVATISRKDGTHSYELCSEHHHHHLICVDCGNTQCIDFCPMKQINQIELGGFTPINHSFEIMGLCSKCSEKLNDN